MAMTEGAVNRLPFTDASKNRKSTGTALAQFDRHNNFTLNIRAG
jgi:hypothetical protein